MKFRAGAIGRYFVASAFSLSLAAPVVAHITYTDLTGQTNGVTVNNFTNYGWANGTRVKGVGGVSATLGDSHYIQIGAAVDNSNYSTIFKFTASSTTHTITATDLSSSSKDYADPAISLYGPYDPANPILLTGAHDDTTADPLIPLATLTNPAETGSTWAFDGLRVAGSSDYDGQFSAFGSFSMATPAVGTRVGLVWLAASSGRSFSDGNASHARGGNGAWGKVETLVYTQFVPGQVYTIIVGGERCIATSKQPYAASKGGSCHKGSWNLNGRYSINVKVN